MLRIPFRLRVKSYVKTSLNLEKLSSKVNRRHFMYTAVCEINRAKSRLLSCLQISDRKQLTCPWNESMAEHSLQLLRSIDRRGVDSTRVR